MMRPYITARVMTALALSFSAHDLASCFLIVAGTHSHPRSHTKLEVPTTTSSATPASTCATRTPVMTTFSSQRSQLLSCRSKIQLRSYQSLLSLRATPDDTLPDTDAEITENAATLRSITFSNLDKDQEPQLLCNFLMELGACSTSITDADAGTDAEQALFHEAPTSISAAMDASVDANPTWTTETAVTTHVWNLCNVEAQFPASADFSWIFEIVSETFPDLPAYTMKQVENKDWVLHVQQSWKPIVLDPFVLRFPWHTNDAVKEAIQLASSTPSSSSTLSSTSSTDEDDGIESNRTSFLQLKLEGGIAFGTGEHPTTQLCLEWVARTCSRPDMLIMDYGAGSGVLGMAACKLDPSIQAVGVDIDVDAVHIANANSQQNDVPMTNYLSNLVSTNDDESKSVLMKAYSSRKGDTAETLPEDLNGPVYDACVANILAGPLVVLAETLAGLVKPSGLLGLSGIMTSQSDMIIDAYGGWFDDVKVEKDLGGWVLITGIRKG